nr:mechanosensitive ion channel domain-containing protein [Actibacterium ureilyticum]
MVEKALELLQQGQQIALQWVTSPAAWSQFVLLILAYVIAVFVTRKLRKRLRVLLTPPEDSQSILSRVRRFLALFLPLLLPVLAFALASVGEQVTRSAFGSGAVIGFGKRVFLFLAARALARDILTDPFLRLLGRFVLVPVAGLYALGLIGPVAAKLEATIVPLGNLSFNLLWLLQFIVVAGVIFWLGRWSNDQSSTFIKRQEEMRPATRQLAEKSAEIAIFGVAFLVLMNIMGVSLNSLAVLTGALGVGIGFGLQKIASNFISGVILLLEGQATVGDYVELDGGEAGTIVKMTARAAILETYDGRWIVVPNEDFITTRVVNYSDSGSANRYEAPFSVSYNTDINKVPAIIEQAVADLDFVLDDPDGPDCELRGFGDSGVDFAVEFWVNGIDDGKNKFTPRVLFAIWNALKDNGIEIPYPHRVVEFKNPPPQA